MVLWVLLGLLAIVTADNVRVRLRLNSVRWAVQNWANQQGEDRCHYYPELFRALALMLNVTPRVDLMKVPREQFRAGCVRFEGEHYEEGKL